MPKMLITDACIVAYGDDRGGVHRDVGDIVDVSKDTAIALTRANRALYINKSDDPDKGGRQAATKDIVKAAQDLAAAKAKEAPES